MLPFSIVSFAMVVECVLQKRGTNVWFARIMISVRSVWKKEYELIPVSLIMKWSDVIQMVKISNETSYSIKKHHTTENTEPFFIYFSRHS